MNEVEGLMKRLEFANETIRLKNKTILNLIKENDELCELLAKRECERQDWTKAETASSVTSKKKKTKK